MLLELLNRTAHSILLIIAVTFAAYTYAGKQPPTKLVFPCTISADGICYSVEYDQGSMDCFTSTGIALGSCVVRDYLKEGAEVCDPVVDWCPMVYSPNRLSDLAQRVRGLVVFKIEPEPNIIKDAYCLSTVRGTECYDFKGRLLKANNWTQIAALDFKECYPKFERCSLTANMMQEQY